MKKGFASTPILLFLILCLSGCNAVGAKSASLTIIYGVATVLSLLLLIGCCRLVRKNKAWLVMLFSAGQGVHAYSQPNIFGTPKIDLFRD